MVHSRKILIWFICRNWTCDISELSTWDLILELCSSQKSVLFGLLPIWDGSGVYSWCISRLPAKVLTALVSGTRSQGRQRKRWIDNVKEDLYPRGSNVSQIVECVKDRKRWRKFVHAAPSLATYEWRWMRQRRRRIIWETSLFHCHSLHVNRSAGMIHRRHF